MASPSLYQVITGGDMTKSRQTARNPSRPSLIPFAATTPCRSRIVLRPLDRHLGEPLPTRENRAQARALDNLYLHNNPRVRSGGSNAGPNTLDDLLVCGPVGGPHQRPRG